MKLGFYIKTLNTGFNNNQNDVSEGIRFLRTQNIRPIYLDSDSASFTADKKIRRARKGALLFTRIGVNVGDVAFNCIDDFAISDNVICAEITSDTLAYYSAIFLSTPRGRMLLDRQKRDTARPIISYENIRSLPMPILETTEQERVIEIIETAFRLKQTKEKQAGQRLQEIDGVVLGALGITLPEADDGALRKRIFYTKSAAVTGTRIDPHFSSPYFLRFDEAVRNYPYRRLNEVAMFSNEVWDQKSNFGDAFPYIEIGEIDLAFGEVNATTYLEKAHAPSRARMIAKPNDILISTTRPNRGAIALLDDEFDCRIASTGFAIVRNIAASVSRKYLFHVLRHRISLTQMDRRSSGGNYPAITLDELEKLIIPLPPPDVQAEIAERVDAIYREAKQLRREGDEILANAKAEVEKVILA